MGRGSAAAGDFRGRDFHTKNGALALRVFGRLSREFPDVRFAYVGEILDAVRERYADPIERISTPGVVAPSEARQLLRASHVLFHPSEFEGVGSTLMEALADGLAIVTAKGGGMAHVVEFLDDRGALFVDRDAVAKARTRRRCSTSIFAGCWISGL